MPRQASCHCGQLRVTTTAEPFAVSICHCLACQRRTGSAFSVQAGFPAAQVEVTGRYGDFSRISEEADQREHVFHFCPDCGSSVFYTEPDEPDLVIVAVGAFADPSFPPPTESGYNTACCESLAGQPDDAIEHLRAAIGIWDGCRDMAKGNPDFDAIRSEPAFVSLMNA